MKRTIFTFLILLAMNAYGQEHFTRILNQHTIRLNNYHCGRCRPIQRTADGGYLLQYEIGEEQVGDYYDGGSVVIKTDSAFHPQWQKPCNYDFPATLVVNDSLIMSVNVNHDSETCTLMDMRNMDYNLKWSKLLCNDGSFIRINEIVKSGANLKLIGYFSFFYDPFIAEMDADGHLLRSDTLAGSDTLSVKRTFYDDSGNYYLLLAGKFGGGYQKLTKLRPDNSVAWSNIYIMGAPAYHSYDIQAMATLPNGELVLGINYIHVDSQRVALVKLSATGSLIWQKSATVSGALTDMKYLPDGHIAISAVGIDLFNVRAVVPNDKMIIIDTAGNVIKARNVSPDKTSWPFFNAVSVPFVKNSNEYYYTAVTHWPFAAMVFNTDSNGLGHCASLPVSYSFYDTTMFELMGSTIDLGHIDVTVSDYLGYQDTVRPQLYVDSCEYTDPPEPLLGVKKTTAKADDILLYPNPATATVHILNANNIDHIDLVDMTGRLINTFSGPATYDIDIHLLRPGSYLVRISLADSRTIYRKLMVN